VWNLLAQARHERNVQRPIGRPPAAVTQVLRLDKRDRKHCPIPSAPIEVMCFQPMVSPELLQ
jgi:hypothetical protein